MLLIYIFSLSLILSGSNGQTPSYFPQRFETNQACQDQFWNCPNLLSRCLEPSIQALCRRTCHHCRGCYDKSKGICEVIRKEPRRCSYESVNQECQFTCGMCRVNCRDKLTGEWCNYFKNQAKNNCDNPYMLQNCPLSCNFCSPKCIDAISTELCRRFRDADLCSSKYATDFCRGTCRKCI